jgi:hypothetical protein
MPPLPKACVGALAVLLATACSDNPQLPPINSGIAVAAIGTVPADTVDAVSQVKLEVYDPSGDGLAYIGIAIHTRNMFVPMDPGHPDAWFDVTGTTADGSGRATVRFKRGGITPIGYIIASATDPISHGIYTDSIPFRILPGHGIGGHRAVPRDTTVHPGDAFPIIAGDTDRHHNTVPLPATYAAPSGISVSDSGVVTASAVGNYEIITTTTAGVDTVRVAVVPES